MAINFLDGITVNSGTGSASTIVAAGTRPVTIKGGAIGSVAIGGSVGGWSTGYFFTGSSGTNRGGFGALGNVDALSYFWIGDAYNDTTMIVQPNAGSVGIGTTAPSDGDLTIGTPKLHVAVGGTSGTFNLAARFQSTTSDADNTGTSILINSSNDRGLLIKAGRKDGDREVAYFDVVTSIGATTNMLTMGKFDSAYNVGIGTTSPGAKLDVIGETRISYAPSNQYRVRITNSDGNGRILVDGDTSNLIFGTSPAGTNATATERMRITSAGNVGIGTTAPAYKLSVENSLSVFSSGDTASPKIEGHLLRVTDTANDNPDIEHRFVENHSLNYGFSWFMDGGNNNFSLRRHDNSANGVTLFRVNRSNDNAYFSGNVGIGTTAPVGKLEVNGSFRLSGNGTGNDSHPINFTNAAVAIARDDNNLDLHAYNAIVFGVSTTSYPTSTERMRITNSGNVGVGTTAPNRLLTVQTTNSGSYLALNSSSNNTTIGSDVFGSFIVYDDSSATYRMVINQTTGNVGIGTTSPSQKLEVSGKAKITTSLAVGAITPSTTTGRIDASNDVVAYSTSDIRLKDNIKSIDKALDKVNSIQGIEFDWIEKEEVHGNSGHDVGVIAQEIEKILPDVVTTRDSGYKAVKYEKIVPLLIEAIKDLSKQVDGLKRLI